MENQVLVPVTEEMYENMRLIFSAADCYFYLNIRDIQIAIDVERQEQSYPDLEHYYEDWDMFLEKLNVLDSVEKHFSKHCKFEDEK